MQAYPEVRSLEKRILGRLTGETKAFLGIDSISEQLTPPDPLTEQFHKLRKELAIFQAMNDPKGIYARLPFNIEIE